MEIMKGYSGSLRLAIVGVCFKSNVFGIVVGDWENWVLEPLGALSNCFALGSYWENFKNHCKNSLSKISPFLEANSPLDLGI